MTPEEIVASAPKTYPFFFQLYVDRNRLKTEELLGRIEKMDQIKAIFVTVDLPVVSKREADERIRESEMTVSVYHGQNATSNPDRRGGGIARSTGNFIDWQLNWEDLAWIRKHSSLPLLVKGIQSAADAKIAMDLGCAGIVVSNHGGRALDNAPATLLILLELRRDCPEVFEKMEVYVDGGVRRGSDVLKAVLLGARGVGVGRPFQCAVAYGTEGVVAAAESESTKQPCIQCSVSYMLTTYSPPRRARNSNASLRNHRPGKSTRRHVLPQYLRAGDVSPSKGQEWAFRVLQVEALDVRIHCIDSVTLFYYTKQKIFQGDGDLIRLSHDPSQSLQWFW